MRVWSRLINLIGKIGKAAIENGIHGIAYQIGS